MRGLVDDRVSLAEQIAVCGQAAALAAPRVLDIWAGDAEFGLAIARANPRATVDAVDVASSLAVARTRVEACGLSQRFRFLEPHVLDRRFEGPYDLALVPTLVNRSGTAAAQRVLTLVRRALIPGGKALAIAVARPHGDAAELQALFRRAGFVKVALEQLPIHNHAVIVAEA